GLGQQRSSFARELIIRVVLAITCRSKDGYGWPKPLKTLESEFKLGDDSRESLLFLLGRPSFREELSLASRSVAVGHAQLVRHESDLLPVHLPGKFPLVERPIRGTVMFS